MLTANLKEIENTINSNMPERFLYYCFFLSKLEKLKTQSNDIQHIQNLQNTIKIQLMYEYEARKQKAWKTYNDPRTTLDEKVSALRYAIAKELFCDRESHETEEHETLLMLTDETWTHEKINLYTSYLEFYLETALFEMEYKQQYVWLQEQNRILDQLFRLIHIDEKNTSFLNSLRNKIVESKTDLSNFLNRFNSRALNGDYVPMIKKLEKDYQKNILLLPILAEIREEYATYCLDIALRKFTEATGVSIWEWNVNQPKLNNELNLNTIEDMLRLGILQLTPSRVNDISYKHISLAGDRSINPESYFIRNNDSSLFEETKLALDQALEIALSLKEIYKNSNFDKNLSNIYSAKSIWDPKDI